MDPSRTPLSPGSLKRRRVSPAAEHLSMVPSGQQQQPTSLPSIRQLHPYLPPSTGVSQPLSPEIPAYPYPGPSPYSPQVSHPDATPSHATGASQRDPAILMGESEADDLELQSPPKKKRRRQALSCTECKRRKIKCDRTQPCLPCTRRGEGSGCQWHIVEPIEKYVTKAEFDHLKARYEQLEAFVRRYLPVGPSAPPSVTYYAMGVQPGMPGIVSDPISSYSSGTSSMVYNPAMMPPPPQSQTIYQQPHTETPQAPQATASRYIRTEPTVVQSPTRHNFPASLGMMDPSASPIMSTNLPPHRTRVTEGMSASPTVPLVSMKTSPLSLASITSPYHPDQPQIQSQPKNYRAQTLRLGERLRLVREDPMISIDRTQQAVLVHPAAQPLHICLVMGRQCPPRPYQCLPTPSYLGNNPPYIGLGIQLLAHQARKGKGSKGDPVRYGVDAIDDNHLFVLHSFLPTSVRRNHNDPKRKTVGFCRCRVIYTRHLKCFFFTHRLLTPRFIHIHLILATIPSSPSHSLSNYAFAVLHQTISHVSNIRPLSFLQLASFGTIILYAMHTATSFASIPLGRSSGQFS